ncbi:MAG TPA: ATP-dependent DNA ligase [Gemmatimonadales bacterium]
MTRRRSPFRLRTLAKALERVEAVRSRRSIVEIVARMLGGVDEESIEAVVNLLQGQLRPPYEAVEVAVGTKLLARILAEAYGSSSATVSRRFRETGDLGLVARSLATARGRSLSVRETHRALLEAAATRGSGSIERKIALLSTLLRKVGPVEAKYLVRISQGRLRLGVGDQTILEATAVAALGDGRRKPAVEHAYNVRCDLGSVVRLAFTGGERALERITPHPGIPVRPALAQRLRSAEEILHRLGAVQAEPKYDGFRLQLHRDGARVWAFSRRLENVTGMFPDLAAALLTQLRTRRAIIEGEAVGYDPGSKRFLPFQVTMTRKRKTGITEAAERNPLRLFAFDLLFAGGRDYIPLPQRERSQRLKELLRSSSKSLVAVTPSITTGDAGGLQDFFHEMIRRGLEGIVAKQPAASYQAGARKYTWVKLKRAYQGALRDTVDLVLVGYLVGRGRRAALGIGSLLGAVYDPAEDRFRTVAKIGSGPSDQQWRELRKLLDSQALRSKPARVDSRITPDVWVAPKYVVEVLADEVTRSPVHTCGKTGDAAGYALRFPRMLNGVRRDKAAEDATTQQEILDLRRLQNRPAGRRGAR